MLGRIAELRLLPVFATEQSSVVCRSVCTIVSPAKTAEPIEMPFGLWTPVGPEKQGPDPHAKGQF